MPDNTHESLFGQAKKVVSKKKGNPRINNVVWFKLAEGKCVQILHVGPFDQEAVSLSKVKRFIQTHGLSRNGLHHEIYLSDFRKTAPEKLRTVLREPVK